MEINKETSNSIANGNVQADSANIYAMKDDCNVGRNNQASYIQSDNLVAGDIGLIVVNN